MDDLEASYRTKGTSHYKGYVANLTKTCDPENELQLITKVQVAPNNVDDTQLLAEALPNLKERTSVETMITDGGYGGEASDVALQEQDVNLVQTAIRGLQPNPDKFHLSDFDLHADEQGHPATLTYPHGQTVTVTRARTSGWQALAQKAHRLRRVAAGFPGIWLSRQQQQGNPSAPPFLPVSLLLPGRL